MLLKNFEHKIKAIFYWLFKICLRDGRPEAAINPSEIKRVLFLRPEKIGDMIISLPVFDALKSAYPHVSISLLASPRSEIVIKNDPRFEKLYIYKKHIWKDIQTMIAIRREQFDCVFDMACDDSVTTLFYSHIVASGGYIIGIGKDKHARHYDFNFTIPEGEHIIDKTMKLLIPFGIDSDGEHFSPPYIENDKLIRSREYINGLDDQLPALKIGLNLSAGMPTRVWPIEETHKFCLELLGKNNDINLILITVPHEREKALQLSSRIKGRIHLIEPGLDLLDVSAVISMLDLLISPDTSLIHIARSFKVPVVGLYNRAWKNFGRWRPYGQEDGTVLSSHEGHLFDITADQVLSEVSHMLRKIRTVA